ncbi:sel1 repeat family protein [Sphingomonas lacunae]|uniref:Sel1 repeat family protein n=1 Tax=Sphingomonas lacunae TaxID=2698828 RepID=A0A6M4APT9_9SPHN|nr:tetratricopeptide repeat protein [Sphingomonas lacunae]QJQ31043.1 sel1 repeat family protein [Sphingomonas lacunae]
MIRVFEILAVVGFSGLAFIGIQIVQGGKKSAIIISVCVSIILLILNAKLEEDSGRGIVGTAYCYVVACRTKAVEVSPHLSAPTGARWSSPSGTLQLWIDGVDSRTWNETDSAVLLAEATSISGRAALVALADSNHARAARLVGRGYLDGLSGFEVNLTRAVKYNRICADDGSARCRNNLASIYLTGYDGVAPNVAEAVQLFRLAIAQGEPIAQVNLADLLYHRLHFQGNPIAPDHVEAARLFQLAADQGNAFALGQLGQMRERGDGGFPPDLAAAQLLYRRAAEQGDPYGQFYLGWHFEHGIGAIEQNADEAIRLYRLADRGGVADATEGLKRLSAR